MNWVRQTLYFSDRQDFSFVRKGLREQIGSDPLKERRRGTLKRILGGKFRNQQFEFAQDGRNI